MLYVESGFEEESFIFYHPFKVINKVSDNIKKWDHAIQTKRNGIGKI